MQAKDCPKRVGRFAKWETGISKNALNSLEDYEELRGKKTKKMFGTNHPCCKYKRFSWGGEKRKKVLVKGEKGEDEFRKNSEKHLEKMGTPRPQTAESKKKRERDDRRCEKTRSRPPQR